MEKNNVSACCRRYAKAFRKHRQNPSPLMTAFMHEERSILLEKIGYVATTKILIALEEHIIKQMEKGR